MPKPQRRLSEAIAARETERAAAGDPHARAVVEERAPGRPTSGRGRRDRGLRDLRDLREPDPERDLGPAADPEAVARKILLDQLTGRARSRAELATKLAQRNVPSEIATRLLDRFTEVGLIDDDAFARDWVGRRQAERGLARRALAVELRRKGIDDETARAALDQAAADDPDAEFEAARTLVRRKLRSVAGVEHAKAMQRLVGMLARKGHAPSVAYRVVREELEAIGRSDDGDQPDWSPS